MCRLLGYLGTSVQLDRLLYKPEHSLIVQSYQPREMTSGLLNADGFGVGWYHPQKSDLPYTYKNTLPIWSDLNLPQLSRYVESDCILSYVRSATPGLSVNLANCQPFQHKNLLFVHNGYIDNFRQTLYRPIRNILNDDTYQSITGTTDSEHIFALIVDRLQSQTNYSLEDALVDVLEKLSQLADTYQVQFSANIIVGDRHSLIACRYSNREASPTLYWYREQTPDSDGVIIASEPLFAGNWNSCPEKSIISVRKDLEININSIS